MGKHQVNMLAALSRRKDVELELLVPVRDAGEVDIKKLAGKRGGVYMLPGSARSLEMMWRLVRWPSVDAECAGSDWVYSPFEVLPAVRSVPTAATIHAMLWFDKSLPWYGEWWRIRMAQGRIYRHIAQKCGIIACVSEGLRQQFCEKFPDAAPRTRVVWNGVEDEYFDVPAARIQPHGGYVMIIGALTPRKGAQFVFELARMLQKRAPDVTIKVASGKDSPAAMLEEAAAYPNLKMYGYLDTAELCVMMRDAAALLHVSQVESFGMPAVEAMAAGLPVISLRTAVAEEILGGAAVMCERGDVGGVCDAVMELFGSSTQWARFSQEGCKRAERYRWDNCAQMLVSELAAGFTV